MMTIMEISTHLRTVHLISCLTLHNPETSWTLCNRIAVALTGLEPDATGFFVLTCCCMNITSIIAIYICPLIKNSILLMVAPLPRWSGRQWTQNH